MSYGAAFDTRVRIAVLICGDHPAMREVIRDVIALRARLCLVGEAASGEEVIVEARRLQPDVIRVDLAMPKRTGYEVLPELRVKVPASRIVVFSAFAAASVARQVIEPGAVLYLEKGADPEAINDALEAAAAMSPPAP